MTKVVGLGAPISVQITIDGCEIPVLKSVLDEWIAASKTQIEERRSRPRRACASDLEARLRELQAMASQLAALSPTQRTVVLWPTVLAHDVLRDAVREAIERLLETVVERAWTVSEVQSAVRVISACVATSRDFTAIDTGGHPDVWL